MTHRQALPHTPTGDQGNLGLPSSMEPEEGKVFLSVSVRVGINVYHDPLGEGLWRMCENIPG